MRSVFLGRENTTKKVYADKTISYLKENADLYVDTVFDKEYVLSNPDLFSDTEFIFSTWGMPSFTQEEIKSVFPKLRCVFYAAGSVQSFAREFLCCGIKVISAWAANAVPVAEYTVSQIILANKGFFQTSAYHSVGEVDTSRSIKSSFPGNFGKAVGLIGAGMIGKLVIKMLKAYRLDTLVFDPFLSDEAATDLEVRKCSLEELFSSCQVVSNHLANNEQTQGMLKYEHFSRIPRYGTFINTGRGAQVVEDDLVRALSERPDLTAILDVTYPEPPNAGHKFYSLRNCILTPHIAGSLGDEVCRMSEYILEEYKRYVSGQKCLYEVNLKMLETMA